MAKRGHAWQRGMCMAKGHVWQGEGACLAGGMRAGETATEVGVTHPTGMHSCLV